MLLVGCLGMYAQYAFQVMPETDDMLTSQYHICMVFIYLEGDCDRALGSAETQQHIEVKLTPVMALPNAVKIYDVRVYVLV